MTHFANETHEYLQAWRGPWPDLLVLDTSVWHLFSDKNVSNYERQMLALRHSCTRRPLKVPPWVVLAWVSPPPRNTLKAPQYKDLPAEWIRLYNLVARNQGFLQSTGRAHHLDLYAIALDCLPWCSRDGLHVVDTVNEVALQVLAAAAARRGLAAAAAGTIGPRRDPVRTAPPARAAGATATADDSGVLDVVVVGAGISGLTTAQALAMQHAAAAPRILVTESRDRVGGNVTTDSNDKEGLLWEEGPNSFQPNDFILQAAVDAGVADELVLGDPKAPRFVYWDKELRPTPSGPDVLTFNLMSPLGKIRAGLGAMGFKAPLPEQEESVEQYVRRNLGAEVFERLIEPFCSGVYAGDPKKLSMKAAFGKVYDLEKKGGSIIGGVLKLIQEKRGQPTPTRNPALPPKPQGQTVGSFRRGLKTLPDAMAAKLGGAVRTSWDLKAIAKEGDVYKLTYDTPQGCKELRSRAVALTIPAYVAADLLEGAAPSAAAGLKSLDYPPVGAITLAYPESAIRPDRLDAQGNLPGFGQLHPRSQGITTLGTIYSSSLFPNRVPKGQVLLLNYFGGAQNRKVAEMSDDELVAQVDKDLRQMLLRPDAPAPRKVAVRVWPRAIPQFNIGHLETVGGAQEALRQAGWDGVLLGGNYVAGVALGKCIEYGYTFAGQVAEQLKKTAAKA
ncbi:Protoporphyrinogen oxidase chloroplastic [Micractinium conductrix]|uniref:Protoporphyrinogen oxidase n=1 Tax=Micractinium conductrix TaxID=554055 RepID=A0A2P6VNG7_9CHLO|nr:Protoporphyrinogen oxidase chloroplastic [Micractinium conductrix]|eukprot:PSC75640.1 Protoporphyrinogen oxidase chloroplastic [Micractinium conductrix]